MAGIADGMRQDIRSEAERFLAQHGFAAPPLSPAEALAARKLKVTQYSLDELLIGANLPPEDHKKIQAMLNRTEMAVTFREGLPEQQRNWGSLHEVGHEFLPWQRELLYHCPLIFMPVHIQIQFEAEADIFAAEAFFFGSQFSQHIREGDQNLQAAIDLAENVYKTSKHATIWQYVEECDFPCCLLVWEPRKNERELLAPAQLTMRYYVKSKKFVGYVSLGQVADPDGAVSKIFNDSSNTGVVDHQIELNSEFGELRVANAQSFSNSYKVFTLIGQPMAKSLYVPGLVT